MRLSIFRPGHMKNHLLRSISILLIIFAIAPTDQAGAQINLAAYRDHFLVGQFGEVCTMCEVVVICAADTSTLKPESIPATGNFTLYYLHTRSFWSQISTIWEWFIANFSSASLAARGHSRPATVYPVTAGNWLPARQIEARLILDPGLLELDDTYINRINRQWLTLKDDTPLGSCLRLPLWESLDTIATRTGNTP